MHSRFHRACFLTSAQSRHDFPADQGYEVAFAGRSNSGKSTVLNALCAQRSLARASKTPGRTRLINFFSVADNRRLVDLPGYGYAQTPRSIQGRWPALLEQYLSRRQALRGLILVMDVRHPLTDGDRVMLDWCQYRQLPVHILLSKADKLRRGPALEELRKVTRSLEQSGAEASVQLFSATRRIGLDEVFEKLNQWLALHDSGHDRRPC